MSSSNLRHIVFVEIISRVCKPCKKSSTVIPLQRRVQIDLEYEIPTRTLGEIYDYFFKWYRGISKRPLSLDINPEINGCSIFDPEEDAWLANYQKHYYVIVRRGSLMIGPHTATLYYKPHKDLLAVRVGVAQLECQFFSDTQIKEALRNAIKQQEYFISDKARDTEIHLEPDRDTVVRNA